MRFAMRCDYCGVFHKLRLEGDKLIVENHSAIIYPIADEDVQELNNSDHETRDEEKAPRNVGEAGSVSS